MRPCTSCPIWENNQLPPGLASLFPNRQEAVAQIQRQLCQRLPAELDHCDPAYCLRNFTAASSALARARNREAYLAGVIRRILRYYQKLPEEGALGKLLDELWNHRSLS
jgi:hypothetical protein